MRFQFNSGLTYELLNYNHENSEKNWILLLMIFSVTDLSLITFCSIKTNSDSIYHKWSSLFMLNHGKLVIFNYFKILKNGNVLQFNLIKARFNLYIRYNLYIRVQYLSLCFHGFTCQLLLLCFSLVMK